MNIFNDIIFAVTSKLVQAMSLNFSVTHAGALLRIDAWYTISDA